MAENGGRHTDFQVVEAFGEVQHFVHFTWNDVQHLCALVQPSKSPTWLYDLITFQYP
jgi:hypothetical protein